MTTKNNDRDLPVPLEGIAEEPITRARAIKLAGAMVGTGAFALFLPDEADALTRRQRRKRRKRRRRQRRQRRQENVRSDQSTVNFGDTTAGGTPVVRSVEIANDGTEPVVVTPTVVGDGFTLVDANGTPIAPGTTITLAPGGRPTEVFLAFAPQVGDVTGDLGTGQLRILDAADGLLLEVVDLAGNVL